MKTIERLLKGHCELAEAYQQSHDPRFVAQLGAFRSNDAEYLIQPLLEDQDRTRETSTKRHRIFRRSALTRRSATTSSPTPSSSSLTSPEPSKCGTRSGKTGAKKF